jgi:hypothetical protein
MAVVARELRKGIAMPNTTAQRWFAVFMDTVQKHEASIPLKEAAIHGQLGKWTSKLTQVICATADAMGWQASAKGHASMLLPVRREEYLGLDVVAFEPAGDHRWRFPVAAIELENSREDDVVAYSLWKVLCVRAELRVVFCYRRDAAAGSQLVTQLSEHLAGAITIEERAAVGGETLLVVGSRDESATFPYGFFKDWIFDLNLGKFRRI